MVSSLLAGIKPLLAVDRGGLLPESLTRKKMPPNLSTGGRLQIGTVAGFTSEYPAGFSRNPHPNAILTNSPVILA
jgi:hypothetical protein